MKLKYKNTYGVWEVTTEGDVEGRSTVRLGTFLGHIDEIALHLADKAYYGLNFTKGEQVDSYISKQKEVHVNLNIDSGTWSSVKTEVGLKEIADCFKDRPVTIKPSNFYASFRIVSNVNIDKNDIEISKALSKLSAEERKLLGY